MSFFGKNIRKIRAAKKLSQTAFADLFNLKRASIGAYEEGRAEAKIDTVIEIANYFKLTLNQLLEKEITLNEIYHLSNFKNAYNETISNEIPFVKEDNFKEFIIKFDNKKYLNSLEKLVIPNSHNCSVAFEYLGDKMSSFYSNIKHTDILVCQHIDVLNIKIIEENTIVVIVCNDNVLIGRFLSVKNKIIVKYDNLDYKQDEITFDKIKKIYQVKKVISNCEIPNFDSIKLLNN